MSNGSLEIKVAELITPLPPIHATPIKFKIPKEMDRIF
jgi:hypothetical protein